MVSEVVYNPEDVTEIRDFAVVLAVVSAGLVAGARLDPPRPRGCGCRRRSSSCSRPRRSRTSSPGCRSRVSIRDVERIGVVALIAILFDGGMQIGWRRLRPVASPDRTARRRRHVPDRRARRRSPLRAILPVSWTTAAIIGAALAPTDPAVMFSVLARRDIGGRVPTILEGEAGANDPVAIALVVGLPAYATTGDVRHRRRRRLRARDGGRRGRRGRRRRSLLRAGDAPQPAAARGPEPAADARAAPA